MLAKNMPQQDFLINPFLLKKMAKTKTLQNLHFIVKRRLFPNIFAIFLFMAKKKPYKTQ